ncbi:MAG TPA: preprotein translocase subunit SecE [Terracidiphilus sp.]|jgi:preprotein translocase subunit SecE|nr:preprotein translocase subunit SecE [Terracidiphilus sp.]
MATSKPAIVKTEERPAPKRQEPGAAADAMSKVTDVWTNFTHFLTDVRSETRKVVTPSRKEVQATTSVVIVTVFLFGIFFFLLDSVFGRALHALLDKMGGVH